MADEVKDRKAADAEAAAEAKAVNAQNKEAEKTVEARKSERDTEVGPVFPNTVQVSEGDFPRAAKANLLSSPVDPNEGWTVQSETPYVVGESLPGQYVAKSELPTKEGLEAHGIDPVSYVAGVPVSK